MTKLLGKIKKTQYLYLICLIFLLNLNSCYFTYTSYSNISNYSKPGFIFHKTDTIFISKLICPDSALVENSAQSLEMEIKKLNAVQIINSKETTAILKNSKIYSLSYNLESEQMEQLYSTLKSKYLLIWYFSSLEETGIGKYAYDDINIDIYDLNNKIKVWSCKSRLSLNTPQPTQTPYIVSLISNQNAINELIEKVIKNEFTKLLAAN